MGVVHYYENTHLWRHRSEHTHICISDLLSSGFNNKSIALQKLNMRWIWNQIPSFQMQEIWSYCQMYPNHQHWYVHWKTGHFNWNILCTESSTEVTFVNVHSQQEHITWHKLCFPVKTMLSQQTVCSAHSMCLTKFLLKISKHIWSHLNQTWRKPWCFWLHTILQFAMCECQNTRQTTE